MLRNSVGGNSCREEPIDGLWLLAVHTDSLPTRQYPAGVLKVTPGLCVGSEALSGLVGIEDLEMAGEQFRLEVVDGRWILRCLGGSCPTYMNGKCVDKVAAVVVQDVIRAGGTVFVLTGAEPRIPMDERDEAGVAGCSHAIQHAKQEVRHAAGRGLSLLLLGETGTGKGLLAQRYHWWSGRSGEFVPMNCRRAPRTA